MVTAWRVAKTRYPAYDGTGAMLMGGRWNSPGRTVIYAADTFAGAILEILAHALRPRTLPGPHHAVRIDIPDDLVEVLEPAALPGWDTPGSPQARQFGDRWLGVRRSAVLVVPALASRPVGRTVVVNPAHPDAALIDVAPAFVAPWDERLF
ncbi:MAG: RES family NAD+ phosphorylase [Candidatus Latescibacterota bacterium]